LLPFREAKLHVQHRSEAKGLLAEIRYLKIKFTRENSFRDDLILQKEYLLDMVGTYTLGYVEHLALSRSVSHRNRRLIKSCAWLSPSKVDLDLADLMFRPLLKLALDAHCEQLPTPSSC
jgi:hypothetical protein